MKIPEKIRACLSYLLGDYLIHLGWVSFDNEWNRTDFCAVSAHALIDKAFDISGRPPAPLGYRFEFEVDPLILSQMATSLFDIYESYKLQNVFWNYWHAKAAPIHMAAAHFGAAIESLQRTYYKNTNKESQLKIISNTEAWDEIHKKINKIIDESEIPEYEKLILNNKTKGLNNAPQSIISEKFFQDLNLTIGPLEKRVWSQRNKAAHGGGIKDGEESKTFSENKILMMLINRIILSFNNHNKYYYDYYTLDRPIKKITDSIK